MRSCQGRADDVDRARDRHDVVSWVERVRWAALVEQGVVAPVVGLEQKRPVATALSSAVDDTWLPDSDPTSHAHLIDRSPQKVAKNRHRSDLLCAVSTSLHSCIRIATRTGRGLRDGRGMAQHARSYRLARLARFEVEDRREAFRAHFFLFSRRCFYL